ncbi:MAG: hypothetical protein AB1671_03035 [Thermodesulfobacteriota bacterium]|jgi:hypothetical protein
MWGIVAQSGVATASVDFTSALSALSVGLLGALVLVAGGIVVVAMRDSWAQRERSAAGVVTTPPDYRQAA